MISKAMQDAINEQIKNEFYSAYLYLSMAAHYEAANLKGFAHWMRAQAKEEQGHAMKFYDYLFDRGGCVTLQAIPQPPVEWKSSLDVFQQVYEHEQKVTGMIENLYALASEENDYASQIMLQWFITEQVEEEKNASDIVEQIKRVGEQGPTLMLLDRQLAARAG